MSEKFFANKFEILSQHKPPPLPVVIPLTPVTYPILSYGGQSERLKAEAAQHKIEKKINEPHTSLANPTMSHECQEHLRLKAYKDAENQFIRKKVKMLSEEEITTELEKNLTQRTPIILLAEVINHCVPPAASSEKVWSAMYLRHHELARKRRGQHNSPHKQ